jgi:hypothetical protein
MQRCFPAWLKAAFLPLALLGMGVRGLVAPGFMLAPAASGLTTVLCSGQVARIDLGAPAHEPGERPDPSRHDICPFAAAAHLAAPAHFVAVAAPAQHALIAARAPPVRGFALALAAPPPPARGPPTAS